MSKIKEQLYLLCAEYLRNKEAEIKYAISEAQEAANNDTKSSAGDKYETGREMMQQAKNRITAQVNEANKLMVALNRINPKSSSPVAENGSLIITDTARFYLAVSVGNITVNDENYIAVSPASSSAP